MVTIWNPNSKPVEFINFVLMSYLKNFHLKIIKTNHLLMFLHLLLTIKSHRETQKNQNLAKRENRSMLNLEKVFARVILNQTLNLIQNLLHHLKKILLLMNFLKNTLLMNKGQSQCEKNWLWHNQIWQMGKSNLQFSNLLLSNLLITRQICTSFVES